MKFQGLLNGAKNINMIKKSKKFKAPEWFHKLHKDTEEKEKELFEYFSEVVGYGPEWCKKNVGKCIEKLEPRERNGIIKELSGVDVAIKYAWSRFYYENWDEIKDLLNVKSPEYDDKKKIIEFSYFTISDKFSNHAKKIKRKIKKNLEIGKN